MNGPRGSRSPRCAPSTHPEPAAVAGAASGAGAAAHGLTPDRAEGHGLGTGPARAAHTGGPARSRWQPGAVPPGANSRRWQAPSEQAGAIWVVEEAHDAYIAAVRFLNRTCTDEVGYYLVQVRFTHGASGSYQVHFEVLAAPIAWERPATSEKGAVNAAKVEWVRGLLDKIKPALLGAGFPSLNMHLRGSYIWVRWHDDLWTREHGKRMSIRATKSRLIVAINVTAYASPRANAAAVAVLEEELGPRLPNDCLRDPRSVGVRLNTSKTSGSRF